MKILVDAYLEKNLGDDLFLKILFDRYPATIKWYVLCHSKENLRAFQDYHNVRMFKKGEDRYKDFDAVINIGGSIFMQNRFWWIRQLRNRLTYALPMKLQKKPLFITGCNYGPSKSKLMYLLNKLFIKYFVTDICFRDRASYHLFKDLRQARYSPDIVYGLDSDRMISGHRDRNKVGICVMHFSDTKINHRFIDKTVELIKRLFNEHHQVELFSFCRKQKDLNTVNQVINKIGESNKDKIELAVYDGNIKDYLSELNSVSYLITLRFHSLVLAQILKINYYPIVYSKKTSNLLIDQGFSGEDYTDIRAIDRLAVDHVLAQMKKESYFPGHHIKVEAENQFKLLDQFLLEFYSKRIG